MSPMDKYIKLLLQHHFKKGKLNKKQVGHDLIANILTGSGVGTLFALAMSNKE